jgi:pimeloyl-ACP methyl ester carboxylesterase
MAHWPSDVAALTDALGLDRFIVAGHSSGGPYALACAALLPERVSACIVLGGVTDMGWPGAWDGYLETEAQIMRVSNERAATAWCVERYGRDGSGFVAASGIELPDPDVRLYQDPQAAPLLRSAGAEAFRQGVTGYAQDVFVQGRPWPFDPRTITAPVYVVHGEADTVLPLAHSRHTAEVVPGAVLRVLAGHGHLTVVNELPTMALALISEGRGRGEALAPA